MMQAEEFAAEVTRELIFSDGFFPLLEIENRYLVLYGGAGSGKSEFAARKVYIRCQREGNHRFLIVRKIGKTLKKSVILVFQTMLEEQGQPYKYNKSDGIITFYDRYRRRNELFFVGLDDSEKLKSIKGITSIWAEEATELTKNDFMQLNLRLREPTPFYKQLMLTFNPDEAKAPWLKEMFFTDLPDDYTGLGIYRDSYMHHSTLDDNPIDSVVEEYRAVLDDIDDPAYTSIYKAGRWAAVKGLIYNWDYVPLPSESEDWYDEIIYGGDFGYTVNEAFVGKIYRKGLEFWCEELIYEKKLTNPELINILLLDPRFDIDEISYWDSDEPRTIQEMRDRGINAVGAIKGKDSVDFGITLLQFLDIHIVEGSTNILDERKSYKFKEDAYGNPTRKPVKFKDHCVDGIRYAIVTHYLKYLREGYRKGRVWYPGMKLSEATKEAKKPSDDSGSPVPGDKKDLKSSVSLREPPNDDKAGGEKFPLADIKEGEGVKNAKKTRRRKGRVYTG